MGPDEYTRALGHERLRAQEEEQALQAAAYTRKRGLWSGIKQIFHQRQRTPSRSPCIALGSSTS